MVGEAQFAVKFIEHLLVAHDRDIAHLVERTAKILWGSRLLGSAVPLPEATLEQFAPIYKLMR